MNNEISFVDKLLATFTAGRVVTILTPILFVPAAGFITVQMAKLGIDMGNDQTLNTIIELATFGLGSLVAYVKSAKWMKAYRAWEIRQEAALESTTGLKHDKVEEYKDELVEIIDEEVEKKYETLKTVDSTINN